MTNFLTSLATNIFLRKTLLHGAIVKLIILLDKHQQQESSGQAETITEI
jgi:hypothetical protein